MFRGGAPGARQNQKEQVILMVTALPIDLAYLDIDVERQNLNRVVPFIRSASNRYRIQEVSACKWEDLCLFLATCDPDVLVFSGHGYDNGIFLEDVNRRKDPIDKGRLARQLAVVPSLKLVIFNACKTERTARYAAEAVGEAIGTIRSVFDDEATAFSKSYFTGLNAGLQLEQSFEYAVRSMSSNHSNSTPMIYLKANYHREFRPDWYNGLTDNYVKPDTVDENGEAHWHCQAILGSRPATNFKFEYVVRWRGFPVVTEYFGEDGFQGSVDLLEEYHENNPNAPGPSRQVRSWIIDKRRREGRY